MGKFICFVVYSKLDKQSPFGVDCLFGIFWVLNFVIRYFWNEFWLVGRLSFVLGLKIFLIFSLKLFKFDNELQIRITVSIHAQYYGL